MKHSIPVPDCSSKSGAGSSLEVQQPPPRKCSMPTTRLLRWRDEVVSVEDVIVAASVVGRVAFSCWKPIRCRRAVTMPFCPRIGGLGWACGRRAGIAITGSRRTPFIQLAYAVKQSTSWNCALWERRPPNRGREGSRICHTTYNM